MTKKDVKKLTFIGTGSAFTVGEDNYHSNMIWEDNGKRLLIDCGSDARRSLFRLGLNYKDIDCVYISHLHADHTGGLEWLAFTTKFDKSCSKPELIIASDIEDTLWNHVLCGGLCSIQGQAVTLESYFIVNRVDNGHFTWEGSHFDLVPVVHVMDDNDLCPCYGLFINTGKTKVFITTDTTYIPDKLNSFYKAADIIFQDCETSTKRTSVHAHFEDLKKLPTDIKEKMWLYHYSSGKLPDAEKEDFKGFVKRGQVFEFH